LWPRSPISVTAELLLDQPVHLYYIVFAITLTMYDVCLLIGTMLPVWKLIGFVLYVVLYYSALDAYTVWPVESLKSLFFKVMPVVHLVFVVISTSMDEDIKVKSSRYRWSIALGLMACGIGDCCQVFADYFFPGVAMFFIGLLLYIYAVGIRPVGSLPVAATFAVAAVAYYFFLLDTLPVLMLKIIGVANLLLLITIAWRSTIVLLNERSYDSFLGCLGSILLIVADVLFVVDKFHESFSRAPFWIMLTYYGAQFGLALSACNTHSQTSFKKND